MYCDEGPSLYSDKVVKARKEHRCIECFSPINPGESYLAIAGIWEGEFSNFKQHILCRDACMFVRDKISNGECLAFGGLLQYYRDGWWDKEKSETIKIFRGMMAKILWRVRNAKWTIRLRNV